MRLLFLVSGLQSVMGTSRRNFKVKSKQVIYDPAPKVPLIGKKKGSTSVVNKF